LLEYVKKNQLKIAELIHGCINEIMKGENNEIKELSIHGKNLKEVLSNHESVEKILRNLSLSSQLEKGYWANEVSKVSW
jgi:hypothetical protein